MHATRIFKTTAAALLVIAAWPAQAGLVTVLPTSSLNANAILDFSEDAINLLDTAAITRTALGTTTEIGTGGGHFNLPITSATTELNISGSTSSIKAIAGSSMGAALDLNRGSGKDLIIGNFTLDFVHNRVIGDTWANGVYSRIDIYTFNYSEALKVSTSGGLKLTAKVDHLTLTDAAVESFASALKLPSVLKDLLATVDYGSIAVDISPTLRIPHDVSGKPYVPPPVPEPSTYLLMGVGLLAAAKVARKSA
jgi:hypothetical protein